MGAAGKTLFVVEGLGRRVAVSATDAGWARNQAALFWQVPLGRRDQLIVREPEVEEHAAYEARTAEFGSGFRLAAVPL